MPGLESFQRRFRPLVAPPGGAAPASVPIDRTADLLHELAAVFLAIDQVEDEADRLGTEAHLDADRRLTAGRAEAARLTAAAAADAAGERASAYAERLRTGEVELREELSAARRDARRIARVSKTRMPHLVEAALDRVLGSPGA